MIGVCVASFKKGFFYLVIGSGMSQAIPIAVTPILTRIYSQEDFGLLALFISFCSVLSVIATARYEMAVSQPKNEKDSIALVLLCWWITLGLSVLLLLIIWLFNSEISLLLGNEKIGPWLYFSPIIVLSAGAIQSLNYWFNRNKDFNITSSGKVIQGGGTAGVQTLAAINALTGGLIVGRVIGQLLAGIYMLVNFIVRNKLNLKKTSITDIKKNATTYRRLSIYSSMGALLDSTALQVPVVFISKFFDSQSAGMFSLTFRILNMPMALLSTAISQVLFQKIIDKKNKGQDFTWLIIKIFFLLVVIMIPFVIFVEFWGEDCFAFVFGEDWRYAGKLASIISIAVAVRFCVSPLSIVLMLKENVKLGTAWQVLYFTTIVLVLYFNQNKDLEFFLIAFSIHEIILYMIYFSFIIYSAKQFHIKNLR